MHRLLGVPVIPHHWTSPITGSTVWQADARKVAAQLPDGVATCSILDGPYGMGKAAWDRIPRGGRLLDLYRGHLDDVCRLSAPSASLYVWNTAEGWGELHPAILALGWTFRSLIVWDKPTSAAFKSAHEEGARMWPETAEYCGFYQREPWSDSVCAGSEIAHAAGRDDKNWIRDWIVSEWKAAGLWKKDLDRAVGVVNMSQHYLTHSQWALPTWKHYQILAAFAAEHGPPRAVPYFVLERFSTPPDLRATYDHLRAEYDHLRAEYEAKRAPFVCPLGVGNVWREPTVTGKERLRAPNGEALHPCQKPLLFADRMIRASTRPGDTVWVPFGGTLRELVAAEHMARSTPKDARRVLTCELNNDGVDYITPSLEQATGRPLRANIAQLGLFG